VSRVCRVQGLSVQGLSVQGLSVQGLSVYHCYEFLNEGTHDVKWDQLNWQKSQRAASNLSVQCHAATFLLPSQLMDLILYDAVIRHPSR
jgi:hypothetical protein